MPELSVTGVPISEAAEPQKKGRSRKKKTKTPNPKELKGIQQARNLAHNQKVTRELSMEEAEALEQELNQERARRGFEHVMKAGEYSNLHCSDAVVDHVVSHLRKFDGTDRP